MKKIKCPNYDGSTAFGYILKTGRRALCILESCPFGYEQGDPVVIEAEPSLTRVCPVNGMVKRSDLEKAAQ